MIRHGRECLGAGVAAIALVASLPACAQDAQRYDLPAQELGASVRAVVQRSGQSIIAPSELLAGKRAPALSGNFTPEGALSRLLEGSGLRVVRAGNALVIQRQSAESAQDAGGESVGAGAGDEAILVTGTRIRGRAPAGAAVTTIDRKAIDQSGYATTQQIVQALPQNFGGGPNETTIETNRGNASLNQSYGAAVNLRGLGTSSTLVLVNGERPPMAGFTGVFADLSMVPTVAIERIEILPDGSSALYGSDAVAGVVNIVPRSRFKGLETSARYALADGFNEANLSAIAGTAWNSGQVTLAYDYYWRSRLRAADRPYVSEDLRSFGAGDYRAGYASPGTIVAGGKTYAIPAGQDGTAINPATLVAGTQNLQDQWLGADVMPEQRRHAVYAAFTQRIGSDFELFGQALFGERHYDRHLRANSNNAVRTVPVTNPFYVDPIGTHLPVQVRYSFLEDIGPESIRGTSRGVGGTLGARLDVGRWQVETHITYGTQYEHTLNYNRINTARLAQALADPNPATAYNLFGDGPRTNPATIARIRGSIDDSAHYRMWSAQLRADGPLFALPGGAARLALGGEYRFERFRDDPAIGDTSTLTPQPIAATPMPGARRVTAGYAELSLPLTAPDLAIPLLRRLDVSAAVRVERYNDFGDTTNPKLGLTWEPFSGVALRGTFGTSFRAPSFNDLRPDLAVPLQFAIGLPDPAAPGGTTYALILRGTVPDLGPERATSWTAGVDLTPDFLPGLRGQLTYFDIRYKDRIASPSADLMNFLVNRATYSAIINPSPDPAVIAAYFAGPGYLNFYPVTASQVTTIIDARTQNLAEQRLNGLDFDLGYTGKLAGGSFEIGASGSYLFQLRQALTETAPSSDIVDTLGNPVDLRMRGRLTYANGGFGAALFANYTDSYTNRTRTTPQRVGAWLTLDFQLSYTVPAGREPLSGTRLSLSVTNLLDADPPFTINNLGLTTVGYDAENAGPLGRVIGFQVSKQW